MLTADARKTLFEELLWEHRELVEAHDKCQVLPEASIDALKEQLAKAQREKEQLIKQHQEELGAQKTSYQELKSQLVQLGLDHAKALEAAAADAAAKMNEALENASDATVVLQAELEELAKARKAAEEKVARLEEERKECHQLILQTDNLAYRLFPDSQTHAVKKVNARRTAQGQANLAVPWTPHDHLVALNARVSHMRAIDRNLSDIPEVASQLYRTLWPGETVLRVACSWYPELDLDALIGVRGAETDLDPILAAKRQDRAYRIAEYAEMRTDHQRAAELEEEEEQHQEEAHREEAPALRRRAPTPPRHGTETTAQARKQLRQVGLGGAVVGEDVISPEFVEAIPPEIQIGGDSPAIMAYTFPKRTLRQVEGWLGDYEGPLTDLLCGMLKELHCETRIPVFKYTYYDGEIVAKHRVSVQLPMRLEMSRIMPYGEAKTFTTAFHMAIFKAILEIRQHKSVELLCSEYSHIPHAEEDEDPALNHLLMANKHPEVAAQHMDSYLEMGFSKPSQYEVGESSGVKKKKKKMRGQVNRNPSWMTNEGGLGEMALVETEDARREREAKEKEEADAAARAEDAPPPPHPMMHPDFQQYMRAMEEDRRRYQESQNKNMQDFFTHVINDRGNEGRGVTLSDFQNARPLPFASAPEPMDAEDWLMDTERKLRTVGCNDEEKIRYATYLLSGPAASWWENLVAVHPPEKVFTWEEFKKKFRDAHVPESVVELKKREFDELHQNTAPIMQYVRDFNRLSSMHLRSGH
ncbi:hypothetical protein QYE76_043729 [Lolium multiflorum]|uniref:Retrotransposon gag domain-containing protein n=1 Tax=Lolium multiflorum TaxID=4521 RepID=A0AAD8THX4_LOLMU|nr:hypothetical protein QYE76_043729 [Lolium multiflorum]